MFQSLRSQRRAAVAIAAGAGAAAALALPVAAAAGPPSFAGSCSFSSAGIGFSPGLKLASVNHTDTLVAGGSCGSAGAGRLTGTLSGRANCTGGQEPATGSGTLTVGGASIPVRLRLVLTLPNGRLTIDGASSGSASGTAHFLNPGNLGAMPGCVGNGLQKATFDATVSTSSTLVGGASNAPAHRRHRHRRHHHHR